MTQNIWIYIYVDATSLVFLEREQFTPVKMKTPQNSGKIISCRRIAKAAVVYKSVL